MAMTRRQTATAKDGLTIPRSQSRFTTEMKRRWNVFCPFCLTPSAVASIYARKRTGVYVQCGLCQSRIYTDATIGSPGVARWRAYQRLMRNDDARQVLEDMLREFETPGVSGSESSIPGEDLERLANNEQIDATAKK